MPKNNPAQNGDRPEKWQPLWSSRLLANGATGEYIFFGYKFGDQVDGVQSTRWHTNMTAAGTLPSSAAVRVRAITYSLALPGSANSIGGVATDDAIAIANSQSFLILTRGDNDALTLPLEKFTSGSGMVYTGTEADKAAFSIGVPDPRAIYSFKPFYWDFAAGRPLVVTIRFDNVVKLSASTWLRVYLEASQRAPSNG